MRLVSLYPELLVGDVTDKNFQDLRLARKKTQTNNKTNHQTGVYPVYRDDPTAAS